VNAASKFGSVSPVPSPNRIQSVDALRGLIIVIMALDHVRDYTSIAAMNFSPTDLSRTTSAIFFTRWITHFCAPVFAFTAGIGAFFWYQHGRTLAQLSRFLFTRGLWLMLLEVTVLRFIMFFQWQWHGAVFVLTVFWMLGLSMVVLAALVYLPAKLLGPVSLIVIASHDLFDGVDPARFGRLAPLWDILHQQAAIPVRGAIFVTAYPLVPWLAVMALGFCCGSIFVWDSLRRRRFLIRGGLLLSVLFIVLRAWNHYGDPSPWSSQSSKLFTLLSFLNTTKYPPSLSFLLMTLGPALLVLALLEHRSFSLANPLIVFGRVPFFFFLFHFSLAHSFAILLGLFRYGPRSFLLLPAPSIGGPPELFPSGYGFRLPIVFSIWLAVVLISYPACRWYAGVRARRRDLWWLTYL
jgi:uncharacterized membrane protein